MHHTLSTLFTLLKVEIDRLQPVDAVLRMGKLAEVVGDSLKHVMGGPKLPDKARLVSFAKHFREAGRCSVAEELGMQRHLNTLDLLYGERNEGAAHNARRAHLYDAAFVFAKYADMRDAVFGITDVLAERGETFVREVWAGQAVVWGPLRAADLLQAWMATERWEEGLDLLAAHVGPLKPNIVSGLSNATPQARAERYLELLAARATESDACPLHASGAAIQEKLGGEALAKWRANDAARLRARQTRTYDVGVFSLCVTANPEHPGRWDLTAPRVLEPRIYNWDKDLHNWLTEPTHAKPRTPNEIIQAIRELFQLVTDLGERERRQINMTEFVVHLLVDSDGLAHPWEETRTKPGTSGQGLNKFLCVTLEPTDDPPIARTVPSILQPAHSMVVESSDALDTIVEGNNDVTIVVLHRPAWDTDALTKLDGRSAALIVEPQAETSVRNALGLDEPLIPWRDVLARAHATRESMRTRVHWLRPTPSDRARTL